jgi:altronate dehydratase
MDADMSIILLDPEDNVAVALKRLEAGHRVHLPEGDMVVRSEIPMGHKIARRSIDAGETVVKYGLPIGRATEAVAPGEHVHVHNVSSIYLDNLQDHYE